MSLDSDIVVSVVLIRVQHVFNKSWCMFVAADGNPGGSSSLSDSCIEIHRLMPSLYPRPYCETPRDALQLYTRAPSQVQIYKHYFTLHYFQLQL